MAYMGLGHVAILTKDMAASIAFYEKIGGRVRAMETVNTPEGEKKLTLIGWAGVVLELIEPPVMPTLQEGCIPHFAVYVDSVERTAEELKNAGVDSFMTPEMKHLPNLFGGLNNWFFQGPSGEQIELLQMLL